MWDKKLCRRASLLLVIMLVIIAISYFQQSQFKQAEVDRNQSNSVQTVDRLTEPTLPRRCFVLHKTHKSNEALLTNRFIRAQSQVHLYRDCQYVLLFWIGASNLSQLTEEEGAALRDTQKALGNENVFVVSKDSTEAAFPGIFEEFQRSRAGWLEHKWEWNMADIPEMVWAHHHLFGGTHGVDRDDQVVDVWMLEYDVLWSGHLGKLLIDDVSGDLNQTYVAWDAGTRDPARWHSGKRFPSSLYQDTPIWAGLIQMVRYRPWILSRMIQQMQQKQYVYCEMRAMMLCVYSNECSWSDLAKTHSQHFGYFTWRKPNETMSQRIAAEVDANVTQKFFHPLK